MANVIRIDCLPRNPIKRMSFFVDGGQRDRQQQQFGLSKLTVCHIFPAWMSHSPVIRLIRIYLILFWGERIYAVRASQEDRLWKVRTQASCLFLSEKPII